VGGIKVDDIKAAKFKPELAQRILDERINSILRMFDQFGPGTFFPLPPKIKFTISNRIKRPRIAVGRFLFQFAPKTVCTSEVHKNLRLFRM
jgi:hypothetical protein